VQFIPAAQGIPLNVIRVRSIRFSRIPVNDCHSSRLRGCPQGIVLGTPREAEAAHIVPFGTIAVEESFQVC
jgi:hypothetical protein